MATKTPTGKIKELHPDSLQNREIDGLCQSIGKTLKQQRLSQNLTIQDVAKLSELSRGMLSRIENGQATPSLDTLMRLCQALGVSVSRLFQEFDTPHSDAKYVPKGKGMEVVRRGTKRGHTYELLSYDQGPKKQFEPFLISMNDESEIFPRFEHAGTEFIYMLKGKIEYRHGQSTYVLKAGDSLTFDANVPHGPERLLSVPIQFISIIYYGDVD